MAKDLFYSLDLNLLRTFMVLYQEKNMRKASKRLFVSQPAISQALQKLRHHFGDELFVKVPTLYQEKNMRKASKRLFVSQPAISQALQKLRHHFGDELFVKVPTGLEATPFTETVLTAITPHLDGLASALNQTYEFNPIELSGHIKIALSPIVMASLTGTLFTQFLTQAPNCTIELVGWNKDTFTNIQQGTIDFGVNLEQNIPQNISCKKLVELTGKLIVRRDHPIDKQTVTAKDLEPYPIASIITPGWNDNFTHAAQLMEKEGATPTVGFRSEIILAVIDIVQHTNYFMPHSNLFPLAQYPNLRALNILVAGVCSSDLIIAIRNCHVKQGINF
ncbi:LysR family transcriptional regulator [Vibrio vulnificus]|uniref:LysR family transcriptional regulator n=1 Tax=Vibrio vulnificus TaxID=672 RepID=UPI000929F591|nr:LysR family transcriptional regulator [Vibrio vulnificus]OJI49530.1 HTH-type transcriptional regulator YidZ [Vibrio vulnificus]